MPEFDYADLPIENPNQDMFGIDPFAASLARSIRRMKTPQGVVLALNGSWGSGKSSALNLLRHHLADAVTAGEIEIVTFNPWWFRGEEALVLAFFRELYAATKPSLPRKALNLLPKLGARLLKTSAVIAPLGDAVGAHGAGAIAAGVMDCLSEHIKDSESVEKLHRELAAALGNQEKRFVVFIDDIDRLAPDEALAMFRLVKSVGRLPNVIYLLAFDRLLAERIVSERFPSEGPHYLEKIVQVAFELPAPELVNLRRQLLGRVVETVGSPEEAYFVDFSNLFQDVVAPEITTPRDVVRFANALSVTYPAVDGEVDRGDFVSIEAYRLFQPALYGAIRAHPELLCGGHLEGRRDERDVERLDLTLLGSVTDKARYQRGLMRLFPRLQSVWKRMNIAGDAEWARRRRLCSTEHFPVYFRLSLPENILPAAAIRDLITRADDILYIGDHLTAASRTILNDGGSEAAQWLDVLTLYAVDIPVAKATNLLTAVFAVAEVLGVDTERTYGITTANNTFRIHWLIRALLYNRTSLAERSAIIVAAARAASLGWLVNLAGSAWEDHHPREGAALTSEDQWLTTTDDADRLREAALIDIVAAAAGGTLIDHKDLGFLLFCWRDFAADNGDAARAWTDAQLDDDYAVPRFTAAFTSYTWSQGIGGIGLGDAVAKRSDRAQVKGLHEII